MLGDDDTRPIPKLSEREEIAWALYCNNVHLAARNFWWELSPQTQAVWLQEADLKINQQRDSN